MIDEESYITADLYAYKKVYKFKTENKLKSPTVAESYLWELLRNKKLGVKFRRQQIIDIYIVDFVCLSKKLVVEVDGEIHKNRKEYDLLRTLVLNLKGYSVIRFSNDEVLMDSETVIEKICLALNEL